jgi:ABC-type sugar transport system substrate-binding protein
MKKLKFLISLRAEDNPFQKLQEVCARQAAQRLGIDVEVRYAGNDAITQSEQLLKAIQGPESARPNGIVCAPVGTTLVRVAQQAATAGIGWALLNREGDYIPELRRTNQAPMFAVTVDQGEIGRIQGQQIGALLPEGGMVLCVTGSGGNIADHRLNWMQSTKPASVQVRTLSGNWSEESGYKAVSRWLQLKTAHETPVTLIAGQNDDMAMGARRAFDELTNGQQRERWLNLPYLGCDCCPGAGLGWVRQGLLTASVVSPPTAGIAVEQMVKALRTKTQPPERTCATPDSEPSLDRLKEREKLLHATVKAS